MDGKPTSLLELGYNRIGLDDAWQACGKGVNGSFHDAHGTPLIRPDRFPDMVRPPPGRAPSVWLLRRRALRMITAAPRTSPQGRAATGPSSPVWRRGRRAGEHLPQRPALAVLPPPRALGV